MATQQPSFGHVEQARIAEIDISGPARALAVLRATDYTLVVACGLGVVGMVPELASTAAQGGWAALAGEGFMVAILAFAAYTGWRHTGVIDPRVWRSYLKVFPLLALGGLFIALVMAAQWISAHQNPLEDVQSFAGVLVSLWIVGLSIPGFVAVVLLRRIRIAPLGIRLDELLTDLAARGGEEAPRITRVERPRFRRGVLFAVAGGCVLLATTLTPMPDNPEKAATAYRITNQVNLFAFFLIVRARRYFQVSADSLLAVDKRRPILFLRSFTDDEKQQYGNIQRALLDFSLETRLANHFYHFGPFIGIGSPKDTVPVPGAARVLLSDDEWQSRVLGWMESANLIVMYCGTTHWVNWELQRIIERGRSTSLILMIPEIKGWRAAKRRKDIEERVRQLRETFRNTEWNEELTEFNDFAALRAMLFRPDGSMVMVRSRSRSRDSYHLAALIAHQQLLDPLPAVERTPQPVMRGRRRRWLWVGTAVAGGAAALLGTLIYIGASNQPARLPFKKGELYYAKPVTEAEAGRVGQFLVDQDYFSDEKGVTVRLDRKQDRYQLQLVINRDYAEELLWVTQWAVMGSDISRDVLGGKPVDVVLCDDHLKPIRTAPESAKLMFGAGELYYVEPVTAAQAQATGNVLQKLDYFEKEKSVSVHLDREHNTYQLRFVVNPSSADNPAVVGEFRRITYAVASEALGGEPIMLHLCDERLHTIRSERLGKR